MDLRPVFYIIGFLLCALSLILCIPGIVDAYFGNPEWEIFIFTSLVPHSGIGTSSIQIPCSGDFFTSAFIKTFCRSNDVLIERKNLMGYTSYTQRNKPSNKRSYIANQYSIFMD